MPLFASLQGWDKESQVRSAEVGEDFDGFAVGGLLAGGRNTGFAAEAVQAVREAIMNRPLHAFGVGQPSATETLFEAGTTSVDSSSYVQAAARNPLGTRSVGAKPLPH